MSSFKTSRPDGSHLSTRASEGTQGFACGLFCSALVGLCESRRFVCSSALRSREVALVARAEEDRVFFSNQRLPFSNCCSAGWTMSGDEASAMPPPTAGAARSPYAVM